MRNCGERISEILFYLQHILTDDVVVETKIFSGDDAVVSYDFEGKPGTAVTVYARINGVATDSQVISF